MTGKLSTKIEHISTVYGKTVNPLLFKCNITNVDSNKEKPTFDVLLHL